MDTAPTSQPSTSDSNVRADEAASHNPEVTVPDTDAIKRSLQQLSELREYLTYYLDAQIDGLKLSVTKASYHLEWILVGILAVAGLIVVAVTLIFIGVGIGVGEILGTPWLGYLIAGLLMLVCVSAAMY